MADSAFPSGAFSHSFGLETAILERGVDRCGGSAAGLDCRLPRTLAWQRSMRARSCSVCAVMRASDELDAVLAVSVFAQDVRAAGIAAWR